MPKGDYAAFRSLDSFFAVVMEGLSKFVDGEHYFDTLDDDVLFEFRYDFPGWPQITRGRASLMALYSGYGNKHPRRSRRCADYASFRERPGRDPRVRSAWEDTRDRYAL
jgi:ketosteroid isomerase-like protein